MSSANSYSFEYVRHVPPTYTSAAAHRKSDESEKKITLRYYRRIRLLLQSNNAIPQDNRQRKTIAVYTSCSNHNTNNNKTTVVRQSRGRALTNTRKSTRTRSTGVIFWRFVLFNCVRRKNGTEKKNAHRSTA